MTDNIENVTIKLDQKKSAALKAYYGDAFSGGEVVGRTNYYDIPLTDGTSISA